MKRIQHQQLFHQAEINSSPLFRPLLSITASGRMLLAFLAMSPFFARASDSGTGTRISGQTSQVVALSLNPSGISLPTFVSIRTENPELNRLTIHLSGTEHGSATIRLPLQIRSNARCTLIAEAAADQAKLEKLLVTGIRPTGMRVLQGMIENIVVHQNFEGRLRPERFPQRKSTKASIEFPAPILTAPPVSRGGSLRSPTNAAEIDLLLAIRSDRRPPWTLTLTISARQGH